MKAKAVSNFSEGERRYVDAVLGLVLYAIGAVLLALGFTWLLYSALPLLTYPGAEVLVGALTVGLSVALFKIRV